MPGILASGKRLEELCLWKLQGNRYGRCLDLSRERLSNFESYEAIGVESKDGSPPKVTEDLNEFDSVEMVDLSHNFLQSADVILRLVPNAFWINLAYNDIEYIPDDVCLPTVMGSLNVSHNEALPLDSLEVLRNKYILRLFVDLGVARVRGKNGLPTENRSSEVYKKRIAELTSKCPNIWVVNDAYIPAVERGPSGQREQMTDTLISTEVVPRDGGGKMPNILLRLSTASDWCSRVPSPRESTFLSALQSFSSSHPLDVDCFSLDLVFEDYLEEARVANEKGVCYHGLKGHRYPTVDVNKVLGLSRELRLDLTVLLSSYIVTGIPENIFQEAMQAVVGMGTMTVAEVKDICHLPEFAHTALICLLRRTIMKDHDDFYGDDDAAALKNLRMVSVQPRYIYEFTHLRGAHLLLHGPTGQNTGKGKHGRLPMLSRTRNNNNAPGKVPQSTPSAKEVNLLNLLPDIVTSRHKPMMDRDLAAAAAGVGVHTIGSKSGSGAESGDTSGSWGEILAVRTIELLEKSAEYRSQTNSNLPSSQTMADATLMLDPLIRTAYQQQGLHQGSFQENTLGDGELKSLSMVSEGADEGTETKFNERATEGDAEAQALALRDNSQASSKRLVVSLVSDNKDTSALLDAPTSLDLSVESGTSPLPKHKHQPQLLSDDGDARFALEIGDEEEEEEEEGSPAGLRLLPERGAQSLLSSAYPSSRVSAPTTDVALFTADRVAEAKFGLLPYKETLRNAKNSSEGVAMLHESPVFVLPYQLPKLEVESVSLDRLGPVPEGWQSDLHDNCSLGSSTAESTPSVMSTATAARTMLAEMGTLRNVRNMMRSENRQAQSKVDNTTWRPGSVGAGRDTGRNAESPPGIRLSTTFSAYGDTLGGAGAGASASASAGAGAYGGEIATSWLSGLVHQPTRDEQKPASLSEFLENSWKAKEQEREEGLRASKEQRRKTPQNLQTRVVAGVNDKLISLTSPIDNLKMATKYRNINMYTSYEDGDGEVIYSEKTPEGRPLSATWYPVKDKKQYMVANSPNQNPLQVVTQETATWTVRQGSPTSRGGGYTVRPTSKSQILRGHSAVERSVNSKAINGHNEAYWPLPKHERQSEFTRALKDTSDIILTASMAQQQQQQVSESTMLMKQKIHAGQYLRPSSRGPIPAATTSLHLNSGYKIKEATHDDSPVRMLRATGQTVKKFRER